MTSAQVVETSVTNNSSFQNYPHQDDHTIRTTVNIVSLESQCFPRRFSGNKIHCSPRDQSLSVNYMLFAGAAELGQHFHARSPRSQFFTAGPILSRQITCLFFSWSKLFYTLQMGLFTQLRTFAPKSSHVQNFFTRLVLKIRRITETIVFLGFPVTRGDSGQIHYYRHNLSWRIISKLCMFNTAYIGLFDRSLLRMSLIQVELGLKQATCKSRTPVSMYQFNPIWIVHEK